MDTWAFFPTLPMYKKQMTALIYSEIFLHFNQPASMSILLLIHNNETV